MQWYWIVGIIFLLFLKLIVYMVFFKKKIGNEKAKKGD